LKIIKGTESEFIAVDHGFAKVIGNTISVLTEAAVDVKDIDLADVESAQARAEEALRLAALEGHDPTEVDRLESNIQYLVAQKLAKGRRRY
jgi:F0F1-type ATP synthase epsilon subunit